MKAKLNLIKLAVVISLAGCLLLLLSGHGLGQASQTTTPAITISPTSGPVGTMVAVSGSGFSPDVSVEVKFDDIVVATEETNLEGGFTLVFAVPFAGAAGEHTVTAMDGAGISSSTTFTVPSPVITLTPSEAPAGTVVTVTGTGFPPYTVLSQLAIGPAIVTPIPSVITDSQGNFSATFVVPALSSGVHTVIATCGAQTASGTFEITPAPVPVSVALITIDGRYSIVWGFEAETQSWRLYDPAAPTFVNTLESLETGKAYWIHVTEDVIIVYGGNRYNLVEGWNLIGWRG